MQTEQQPMAVSVTDLAVRWRVDRQVLHRAIQRKKLPAFRVGKIWRILERSVAEVEAGERSLGK